MRGSELRVEIAGISSLIRANDADFLEHLGRERYEGFLADKDPAVRIDIEVRGSGVSSLYDGRGPLIEHFVEGNQVAFRSFDNDIQGSLNVATGEACGIVRRAANRFDSFLRIVYSFWLVKTGGFLLHAAGVSNGAGACVFFGVSGSGKTSIARMSGSRTVLSDELVAIKKDESSSIYWAYATPFWGEFAKAGVNRGARLKQILLLKKDHENYVTRLGETEALTELMPCILFFGERTDLAQGLFNTCCDMVASTPFFRLHFLQDESFWECLGPATERGKYVKS